MDEAIPLQEAANRFGVKVTRLRKAADEGRLEVKRLPGSRDRLVRPSEVRRFLKDAGQARATGEAQHGSLVGADRHAGARARIIAVAIPKGGTGKTTTTANLGAALAERGKRVLLVDLDPQGSLTITLNCRPGHGQLTVYDIMSRYIKEYEGDLTEAIMEARPNLDLVPATSRLNLANTELINARQREFVLRQLLDPLRDRYDLMLIDTLPYLGILVENALAAADEVLIPSQAQHLSTESIDLITQQVNAIRKSGLNPNLRVAGIVLTQVKENRVVDRHYRDGIRMFYDGSIPVFQTEIRDSADVQKSQAMEPPQTLIEFAPLSHAANAYRALAEEVLHAPAVA